MFIRTIQEYSAIIDSLIYSLSENEYFEVAILFTGTVKRTNGKALDFIKVKGTPMKVFGEYNVNGCTVSNTIARKLAQWCSENTLTSDYQLRTNAYLTFIESIDEMEITDLTVNGESIIGSITYEEHLNIGAFIEYIDRRVCSKPLRIKMNNGEKSMSVIYTDKSFTRMVKVQDNCTYYINSAEEFNKQFKEAVLTGVSICSQLPGALDMLNIYSDIASKMNCKFKYEAKGW